LIAFFVSFHDVLSLTLVFDNLTQTKIKRNREFKCLFLRSRIPCGSEEGPGHLRQTRHN